MRKRPFYTDEFKADALDLLERTDRSLSEVAQDLGVSSWTLRYWYKQAQMAKGKPKRPPKVSAASTAKAPTAITLEAENLQLKRELKEAQKRISDLELDRAILKKATAFFAKESE